MGSIETTLAVSSDPGKLYLEPFEALAQTNRILTREAREFIESFRFDVGEDCESTPWVLLGQVDTPTRTETVLGQVGLISGKLELDAYSQSAAETRIYTIEDVDEAELKDILVVRRPWEDDTPKLDPKDLTENAQTYFVAGRNAMTNDEIMHWAKQHSPNSLIAPVRAMQRARARSRIISHISDFDGQLGRIKDASENPMLNPQLGA